MQSSMTCLCLETSLPMQRSHWHLMSRHFCLRLVSRNSTATAISMHRSFTKPQRTLWRGYTPPRKWSRLVKITCGLHHMQLGSTQITSRAIPCREQLIGSAKFCMSTGPARIIRTCKNLAQNSDSANHPNIDQLWWVLTLLEPVFFLEEKVQRLQVNLPLKSNTGSDSANPHWTDAPCKASAVSKGTQSTVKQKTCSGVNLIDQFVRTASVVFTLPVLPSMQSSMTCLCLETSLPMQRSHWHLMSRHFCLRLVSRNSTATAISMHHLFTKPQRTLQRGYINVHYLVVNVSKISYLTTN